MRFGLGSYPKPHNLFVLASDIFYFLSGIVHLNMPLKRTVNSSTTVGLGVISETERTHTGTVPSTQVIHAVCTIWQFLASERFSFFSNCLYGNRIYCG